MHAHIFWTYSGSRTSKLVRLVDGGPWTHVGLVFVGQRGDRIGFEARTREGWTGPYTFRDTEQYIERMGGEMYVSPPLPMRPCDVMQAYARAVELGRTSKPYSRMQLWWIWMRKRYHVPVPRSKAKMICSEGVVRALSGLGPCPAWGKPDQETPGSLWRWYCQAVAKSHAYEFGVQKGEQGEDMGFDSGCGKQGDRA